MKKILFIFTVLFFTALTLYGYAENEITKAIGYAYNFQFDKSRIIIDQYIRENPEDLSGYAGRIVFDFLVINQNPDQKNINTILHNLRDFEIIIDEKIQNNNSVQNRYYKCFADYYFMKSFALNSSWINSFTRASRSRSLALELKNNIDELPDLYFIIGDQDYTASLIPQSLLPLMRLISFKPYPENGLKLLEKAMEKGILTRHEARMFYISSMIYVENDFRKALEVTEKFLKDFPDNLSAVFYKADILLRKNRISDAQTVMDRIEKDFKTGKLTGKWLSKYFQIYGNYYNALGNYPAAIEYYDKAVLVDNISSYAFGEITLEMGKLYDILGDRKSARSSYWNCEKSGGLIIHREEAKLLRSKGYTGTRASY